MLELKIERNRIHTQARKCAAEFRRAESELIDVLQLVRKYKVYQPLGYTSLFDYCTRELKLSRDVSLGFIRVANASEAIPQLKAAVRSGTLTVATAKRICSVITPQNQSSWINKAATLKQRELDREIVTVNPKLAVIDRIKPVAHNRSEFRCGVSSELEKKIERMQDVLSQKRRKACSFEEVLEYAIDLALSKSDPLQKAQRWFARQAPRQLNLVS